MKYLSYLLAVTFLLTSCNTKKDYVTLTGHIENNTDSIFKVIGGKINKEIAVDSVGNFSDTIKLFKPGNYNVYLGNKRGFLYLDNGYEINLEANGNNFFETFKISGEGSSTNNFILSQFDMTRKVGDPANLFLLEKEDFLKKVETIKTSIDSLEKVFANKDVDTSVWNQSKKMNNRFLTNIVQVYDRQHEVLIRQREYAEKIVEGKPSPEFNNYANYKGGKKSLKDFRGKYIYIDVWATWCGPCITQIPYLKKLEKKYKYKNIAFVSLSTDEASRNGGSWEAAEKKWKNFVKEKQLSGVQLWAGKDYAFQQAYQITTIPRFILIDPKGNIVDANAPRPSDPRLIDLFKSKGI